MNATGVSSSTTPAADVVDRKNTSGLFPNQHGVKVSYLNKFLQQCGGREALAGMTTFDVCNRHVKTLTLKSKSSLCDRLCHTQHEDYMNTADVFVSHVWKYTFVNVVDTLIHHFCDKPDTVLWFDLFSINQHEDISRRDNNEWWQSFQSVIVDIQHTVMVVLSDWQDPIAHTRAWCIFEAYCSAASNCKYEIAMSVEEEKQFLEDIQEEYLMAIDWSMSTIDAKKSECFLEKDQENIFAAIAASIGFDKINSVVFEKYRNWVMIEIAKKDYEYKLETLGNLDPATLSSMNSLATLHHNQGRHEETQQLYEKCLELRVATLEESHSDTLTSMNDLALLYMDQGNHEEAQPLFERCLELRKETLAEAHPDTLTLMNNLAVVYTHDSAKSADAESLLQNVLQLRRTTLGDHHHLTFTSMNNLASFCHNQGKLGEAQSLYEKCLELRSFILGEAHPETLTLMNDLAVLYLDHGKQEKAESLLENVLERRRSSLGGSHHLTLTSMNNLASLHHNQGKHDEAQPLYEECLQLRNSTLGHSY